MVGSILQLAASGVNDIYLNEDPQVNLFKIMYRRHTPYSMLDYKIDISNQLKLSNETVVKHIKVPLIGDLLHKLALVIDLPTPNIEIQKPTHINIQNIFDKYNIPFDVSNIKPDQKELKYTDIFDKEFNGDIRDSLINTIQNYLSEKNTIYLTTLN